MCNKIDVMGITVSALSADKIVDACLKSRSTKVVNTINSHGYMVQKSNPIFRRSLINSDYVLPDGIGIVYACRMLNGMKINKISGYDFFLTALDRLNIKGGRVFFLGSSITTLDAIKERAESEYSNLEFEFLSPPFQDEFDENDCLKFAKAINKFSADIVFVGLTAPKQESLIAILSKYIDVNIISGIGAVFDFYSGSVKRPSERMIRWNLEWFGRLLTDPTRLWKRSFVSMPKFIVCVIHMALKKRLKS